MVFNNPYSAAAADGLATISVCRVRKANHFDDTNKPSGRDSERIVAQGEVLGLYNDTAYRGTGWMSLVGYNDGGVTMMNRKEIIAKFTEGAIMTDKEAGLFTDLLVILKSTPVLVVQPGPSPNLATNTYPSMVAVSGVQSLLASRQDECIIRKATDGKPINFIVPGASMLGLCLDTAGNFFLTPDVEKVVDHFTTVGTTAANANRVEGLARLINALHDADNNSPAKSSASTHANFLQSHLKMLKAMYQSRCCRFVTIEPMSGDSRGSVNVFLQ